MKQYILALLAAVMILGLCACAADSTEAETAQTEQLPELPPAAAVPAVMPPQFSHWPGAYSEEFVLTLQGEEGTVVRYTLDGTEPCENSPEFPAEGLTVRDRTDEPNVLSAIDRREFTREIYHVAPNVSKATIIRAAAFSPDGRRSEVITASYLVGLDYEGIKVISLVMDAGDLFDYERGIYVFGKSYDDWVRDFPEEAAAAATWELEGNFTQRGRDWEREVLVQVINEQGVFGTEQTMGIRIMGGASRTFYQKSLRLIAREEYGAKRFEYPIISGLVTDSTGEPLTKYKSFLLRNGGNDNLYSHMRDPFLQGLLTGREFATQASEPCVVFINGEYWGVYTITEDYSDNYIQYNYGVDNKNVVLIKNGLLEEGREEDIELYTDLTGEIISRDFSLDENCSWLWQQIDRQSFVDYMAATVYINNQDGIFEGNNWRIWRAREVGGVNGYADGKWRFMLYDTDFSMGLHTESGKPMADTLERVYESEGMWAQLLCELLQNDSFRALFVNTLLDLRNTVFEPESAQRRLDEQKLGYAPYMPEQYERNGPSWKDSKSHFANMIDIFRWFLKGRYKFAPEMISTWLEVGEAHQLTLQLSDPAAGTVQVNTVLPDLSDGSWKGVYFSDIAITLTAYPAEGYEFAGWSGGIEQTDPTVTLNLSEDTAITANFC